MHLWTKAVLAGLLGLAAALAWGQATTAPATPAGPSFICERYVLRLSELKAASDVDLADPSKSKFTVELKGSVQPPKDVDAVAVAKKMAVVSTVDAKAGSLLAPVKSGASATSYRTGAYSAVLDGSAEVEVARTELVADAAKLSAMVLKTEAVIAKTRQQKDIKAVVMEDFVEVSPGVTLRITSLKMSGKRELTFVAEYRRRQAGTGAPFLEAGYALDAKGKVLNGGRWNKGDPFGKTGTMTYILGLPPESVHQTIRFVVVTESQTKELTFKINRPLVP